MGTFMFLSHPANTEVISWHAGYPYAARAVLINLILIFLRFSKNKRKEISNCFFSCLHFFSDIL